MSDSRPEFSVWVFTKDGLHTPYVRWLTAERAVAAAKRLTDMLGAMATEPDVEKVIITDGGDDTVFEWRPKEGVVYPRRDVVA